MSPAAPAQAWGSLGHDHRGWSPPWPLDGLAADEARAIEHVMGIDTRKSTVPGEGERHYIDIDAYPEYHAGTLNGMMGGPSRHARRRSGRGASRRGP